MLPNACRRAESSTLVPHPPRGNGGALHNAGDRAPRASQAEQPASERVAAAAGGGARSTRARHGDAGGAAVSGGGDDWNLPVLLMAALSAGAC
ncbi:hypothetical protein GCM10010392_42010 [Streptomyces clavifer]|nr:hypothetical protein GCM10010392_42010 [Streptomyces clavifer]